MNKAKMPEKRKKSTIFIWHPSYGPKSTLQSFGKKSLQMGNALKKV